MKRAAAIPLAMAALITAAPAAVSDWPELGNGEVKADVAVADLPKLAVDMAASGNADFTFFKTLMGHDYLIISPCCGDAPKGAVLFQYDRDMLTPVGLPVGDPRLGFTTQVTPAQITVDAGAVAIRAHVVTPSCEDGDWRYYYTFDKADRVVLRSVIDTSCLHLGIRELYHSRDVDVGKWWIK